VIDAADRIRRKIEKDRRDQESKARRSAGISAKGRAA
jgi:hypothetical protein